MPPKAESKSVTAAAQLKGYLDRLPPRQRALVRALRSALRKRLPAANELAYDYGHSILLTYAPGERGIEGIVSIAARTDGVRLYFNEGPRLPDPAKILRGSGKATRYLEIEGASELARPEVKALLAAALKASKVPLPASGKGRLLIRT